MVAKEVKVVEVSRPRVAARSRRAPRCSATSGAVAVRVGQSRHSGKDRAECMLICARDREAPCSMQQALVPEQAPAAAAVRHASPRTPAAPGEAARSTELPERADAGQAALSHGVTADFHARLRRSLPQSRQGDPLAGRAPHGRLHAPDSGQASRRSGVTTLPSSAPSAPIRDSLSGPAGTRRDRSASPGKASGSVRSPRGKPPLRIRQQPHSRSTPMTGGRVYSTGEAHCSSGARIRAPAEPRTDGSGGQAGHSDQSGGLRDDPVERQDRAACRARSFPSL